MTRARRLGRMPALMAAVAVLSGGCAGGPILANQPLDLPSPPVATQPPVRSPDPIPIELPRDDGPHDRLTEWWYYTGHLRTQEAGGPHTFGFEAVIFRAERGGVPVAWASHLALTDENGQQFTYAQRSEIGPQVDRSPRGADGVPTGFDLDIAGLSPDLVANGAPPLAATPWRLAGGDGTDRIEAALSPEEAAASGRAFALALDLHSTKPAALHDGDGFVDFADAGSSYYYSRTRMTASGTLVLDGRTLDVDGIAWFDHQWGDFISVGSGGWNWFAINLDDGTDIAISDVIDEHANSILTYATVVAADGTTRDVRGLDLGIGTQSFTLWTSPRTGRSWSQRWDAVVGDYTLTLESNLQSQELDTRATTGVVYWEGSNRVTGFAGVKLDPDTGEQIAGTPVLGDAYVEMTRYDLVAN